MYITDSQDGGNNMDSEEALKKEAHVGTVKMVVAGEERRR